MKHLYIALAIFVSVVLFASCGKNKNATSTDAASSTDATSTDATATDAFPATTEEATTEEESTDPAGTFYGENTGTDATKTGLEPLDTVELTLPAGADYSSYSKTLIEHSFGAAKNGVAATTSINNQKYMDEHGFNALCLDTKTEDKVLYLTFDVGYENGYTEKVLDILKGKGVHAAFFVTVPEMKQNPEIIARMINEGHIVGNHSTTHPNFTKLTQNEIIEELQGFDDYARQNFGYTSMFFRYPEGKYSDFTEKIITDLGYTSVFWSLAYADWDLSDQPSYDTAYNTVVSRLHSGAVILLHAVSPVNSEILPAVIDEAISQGYEFRTLSDYIGTADK